MSLQPGPVPPVPDETARVARAAFPGGNPSLRMRDEWGAIFDDAQFISLSPARGRPAEAPWRLALVTRFQFAEGLSDRQAADAVRGRIDWQVRAFLRADRSRLRPHRAQRVPRPPPRGKGRNLLLDGLLARCRERGLLKPRGRQRTDSTYVLAAVRALNRLELVRETLRHALDELAVAAPAWLRDHAGPEWVDRDQRRSDEYRLPKGKEAQQGLAERIGADGIALLTAVSAADAPPRLREVPAVEILRRVWLQNERQSEAGGRWRTDEEGLPKAARCLSSPHDGDAHPGKKGGGCWVGDKVALTETCEDDAPNLITHVATPPAPTADGAVTPQVHAALQAKGLLPAVHLVDTGFPDAELPVASRRDYGVALLGPTRKDRRWQARAGDGFGIEHFTVDFRRHKAVCPAGHESVEWVPRVDNRGNDRVSIRFSSADCAPCPHRCRCTKSKANRPRRSLAVRPEPPYEALRERRRHEETAAYAKEYARRAGIEGTISQGVRRCGLRRSRYVGLAKTHLGHALAAAAINDARVAGWLDEKPRATTRPSPFAILMALP